MAPIQLGTPEHADPLGRRNQKHNDTPITAKICARVLEVSNKVLKSPFDLMEHV